MNDNLKIEYIPISQLTPFRRNSKAHTKQQSLQQKELAPVQKAHYLISVDVNHNDRIIDMIAAMRSMEGVVVRAACN